MATDHDTSRYQYENYRYCYDNGHQQWVQKASRCVDTWRGEQWEQRAKAQLDREGRPALTLNVVESLIRSMKGIQRALRNDVRYMPVQLADAEMAKVHDAVWLHIQNQNSLDFLETEVYEKGLITGRAYYDVRVSYDESIEGHIKITVPRSQDVVLDPSVDTYDPANANWPQVFKRRWVSYQDIANVFGEDKAKLLGNNPCPDFYDHEDKLMAQQMGQMPYYAYEGMEDPKRTRGFLLLDRQYFDVKTKELFIDVETGDTKEIPESWDRNRISHLLATMPGLSTIKRKVNTVRWDVTCESVVLHKEDSPYKNFTLVPFFPTFLDGITMGAVESLIDPQLLYNKMTSQELHIINTTANSGLIVRQGSVVNMTIEEMEEFGSKSGIVFEVNGPVEDSIKKIQPNQTPAGHDRLSFKADQIMRSLSGVSNSGRGFARDDASSDKVMQDQAAQDINFAGWLSNLHRTKQILASRVTDCVQAFYTDTRVILINRGTVYAPETQEVTINQPTGVEGQYLNDVRQGRYSTVLVPAPARTNMSTEDFELIYRMRQELGISIPDAMMIELSPASNKGQIVQMLKDDTNARQQKAAEMAEATAAAEIDKTKAAAEKERTAGALNISRAKKFEVEAMSDPDASYERVEQQRIAAETQDADKRLEFDREKLKSDEKFKTRELAIKLVEIDARREADKEKAKVAASKPKTPPRPKAKK